jgi:hypothetical protein
MVLNWRDSVIKAAIFGGIAFLTVLQTAGIDALLADPKRIVIPALEIFGLTFLVNVKSIVDNTPTPGA